MKKHLQKFLVLSLVYSGVLAAYEMPFKGYWGYTGRLETTKGWVRELVRVLQPEDYKSWDEDFIELKMNDDAVSSLFIKNDYTCWLEVYRHVEYDTPKDFYEGYKSKFSSMPKFLIHILEESNNSIIYEFGGLANGVINQCVIKAESGKKGEVFVALYHVKNRWIGEEELNDKTARLKKLSFFKKAA